MEDKIGIVIIEETLVKKAFLTIEEAVAYFNDLYDNEIQEDYKNRKERLEKTIERQSKTLSERDDFGCNKMFKYERCIFNNEKKLADLEMERNM